MPIVRLPLVTASLAVAIMAVDWYKSEYVHHFFLPLVLTKHSSSAFHRSVLISSSFRGESAGIRTSRPDSVHAGAILDCVGAVAGGKLVESQSHIWGCPDMEDLQSRYNQLRGFVRFL